MLIVEQVSELHLEWDRSDAGWSVTVGSLDRTESGLDTAIKKVSELVSATKDLGVL